MTDVKTTEAAASAQQRRRHGFMTLGALVVIGLGLWAVYEFVLTANIVSTDDAYIDGDVIQVTSEIPGTIIGLYVDDTQLVEKGQKLVDLDPADAEVGMATAEAGLAQAVRRVRALFAQSDQLRALIDVRQSNLRRAQDDLQRRKGLVANGAVSREDVSHAEDAMAEQTATLTAAQAQLEQTVAQISGTTIATHPDVKAASAHLRNAALALRRTKLVAPANGLVAKRATHVGQRVDPGTPLMAVVPLGDLWVEANFKEVQLERMRVGQPVTVITDLYGNDAVYHGKLVGLSAGTGSTFSLLPPQNATGNWIKIVQRVPVRILLDPEELKKNPLRLGLSTTVRLDVSEQVGALFANKVRNVPLTANPSSADDPVTDALIAKIIDENQGPARAASAGN